MADEELMLLVRRADPRAFALVYDRHCGAAYGLAYRMVGSRGLAEDVVQEAFLALWRGASRYDGARGSVRSWVLGIVHNRAIDALRRTLVHEKRRASDEGLDRTVPAEERTEVEAVRNDDARFVRAAMDTLPTDQRRVVELAYFSGYTHTEIAEVIDVPLGTVKGRMRLGLSKLRDELGARGGDPVSEEDDRLRDEAAAWVLGALDNTEAAEFVRRMEASPEVRREVAELQEAADALPFSVVAGRASAGAARPDHVRRRVRGRAAARHGRARRPPVPPPTPWWRSLLRPLPVAAFACVLLLAGVAAGLLIGGGGSESVAHGGRAGHRRRHRERQRAGRDRRRPARSSSSTACGPRAPVTCTRCGTSTTGRRTRSRPERCSTSTAPARAPRRCPAGSTT